MHRRSALVPGLLAAGGASAGDAPLDRALKLLTAPLKSDPVKPL